MFSQTKATQLIKLADLSWKGANGLMNSLLKEHNRLKLYTAWTNWRLFIWEQIRLCLNEIKILNIGLSIIITNSVMKKKTWTQKSTEAERRNAVFTFFWSSLSKVLKKLMRMIPHGSLRIICQTLCLQLLPAKHRP